MPRPQPAFLLRVVLALAPLGLLVVGPTAARSQEVPYPAGTSTHPIEGLDVTLVVPAGLSPERPASLVVVLHGAGGTATGMAGSYAPWAEDGYVVCAPKSTDQVWEPSDVARVLRIAAHLKQALPIDPKKVHVVGFSNGGWELSPVAFDDALRPCSATWIAAGFRGGQVPKWAKEGMGVLAMAGSEDANLDAAQGTVKALRGKVRSVEVRVQPGLGHAFPRDLVPYHRWWIGVMEGRFTPGDDLSFDWEEDLDAAVRSLAEAKRGGILLYVHAAADADRPEARALQHEVFFDPEVRFYGGQLRAVKWDLAAHAEDAARLGVTSTPAVVVLDRLGKVEKVHAGDVKAARLAKSLRAVAPERAMPKD